MRFARDHKKRVAWSHEVTIVHDLHYVVAGYQMCAHIALIDCEIRIWIACASWSKRYIPKLPGPTPKNCPAICVKRLPGPWWV